MPGGAAASGCSVGMGADGWPTRPCVRTGVGSLKVPAALELLNLGFAGQLPQLAGQRASPTGPMFVFELQWPFAAMTEQDMPLIITFLSAQPPVSLSALPTIVEPDKAAAQDLQDLGQRSVPMLYFFPPRVIEAEAHLLSLASAAQPS
mmetsp:Transcript_53803/g.155302  ORF Transcript_53803/g.155302 Transcript_53803/m.155302 type:complete len:148 (-) Transcript_53803:2245-2688(-)